MGAYRILRARIEAFLALPIDELKHDRVRLKAELDRIGALLPDLYFKVDRDLT
jgi:arsenate reductase